MLWEVEIAPLGLDRERERVCDEFDLLTHSTRGAGLINRSTRGFLLEGDLHADAVQKLVHRLLLDPIVEQSSVREITEAHTPSSSRTVLLKPGVMDPVAESVVRAAADLGVSLVSVRTFRRYYGPGAADAADLDLLTRKILANDAIERVVVGPLTLDHFPPVKSAPFTRIVVPIRDLNDEQLLQTSRKGQLALTLEEMQTIQAYFRREQRDPTDVELESIAQTWSEHCSHKTLKGRIAYREEVDGVVREHAYRNMLKETIFAATVAVRQSLGADDWCVSVFADNAGVVKFTDEFHVCIKVETHNRPSAIEPYGGANTGLGGVIRDVLGTGLGAKPIANTDVFCFARPDYDPQDIPAGVLHPRRVIQGVVAGVRDYGNRMGIPTVNGAVLFDDRYLANPLVFCGTVGLLPAGMETKQVHAGDLIVAVGGRTGRDGIHGATFSSEGLTSDSEVVSGGAVQIGNAITEKKVLDVLLQARDQRLYTAITDCGAGGLSSAVGEMGAELGAQVQLEKAPLKYAGLTYTEIWISESQERMVLSVPASKWEALRDLCAREGVEAAILGTFEATGRLKLSYHGEDVADLDMHFLHDGRPEIVREARYQQPALTPLTLPQFDLAAMLKTLLGTLTVCSKEWIIRQYDHEVQGGSVIKPFAGVHDDGPSDAAVVRPVLGRSEGVAIGNGINPRYADLDPAAAAACAIDEAVRNVVAVGADPSRVAILDNFCWGNVTDPEMLGALVRTAETCQQMAVAYRTPFVSGKDSLNNSFLGKDGKRITIPHTLLVSALGFVPDVSRCVTMDLKEAGNLLYLVGLTRRHLGGSLVAQQLGLSGGIPPQPDQTQAPAVLSAVHAAIQAGAVRACHDLSEGGLAVAVAEMAFSGNLGADLQLTACPTAESLTDAELLYSESPTRFVLEVPTGLAATVEGCLAGLPHAKIGVVVSEPRFRVAGQHGEWVIWSSLAELKKAWQEPFRM